MSGWSRIAKQAKKTQNPICRAVFQNFEQFRFFFLSFLACCRGQQPLDTIYDIVSVVSAQLKLQENEINKNPPIPLPMPRPSKQKVAARRRDKNPIDTASEWEETDSNGYSSRTESPNSTSELESDCEDDEEWRYEQHRLYSLGYCALPTKEVS